MELAPAQQVEQGVEEVVAEDEVATVPHAEVVEEPKVATARRVEVVEAVVTTRHHAEAVEEVVTAAQENVAMGEGEVGVELLLEGAERLRVERSGEKY